MTKSKLLDFIKNILTPIGMFLLGKSVCGRIVDMSVIEMTIGTAMTIGGFIWSLYDKSLTIEIVQTTLRVVIKSLSGFVFASGYINNDNMEAITSFVIALSTMWYGDLSKKKTQQLDNGKIHIDDLHK